MDTTHVFLLHGMGRTPCSMRKMARYLRQNGMKTHLFGYFAGSEQWQQCVARLADRVNTAIIDNSAAYILIGHSLGSVLIRGSLSRLIHPPRACFLITPPTIACTLARKLSNNVFYRLINGDMGQRLADPEFMASLPIPDVPTRIYAGTRGITGRFSPFGNEPNDGILKVSETFLSGIETREVYATHTFIMRSPEVMRDIASAILSAKTGV